MRYRYTDNDGRVGEADSAYFAIANAVGQAIASLTRAVWNFRPGQQTSQCGDNADVYDANGHCGILERMQ